MAYDSRTDHATWNDWGSYDGYPRANRTYRNGARSAVRADVKRQTKRAARRSATVEPWMTKMGKRYMVTCCWGHGAYVSFL